MTAPRRLPTARILAARAADPRGVASFFEPSGAMPRVMADAHEAMEILRGTPPERLRVDASSSDFASILAMPARGGRRASAGVMLVGLDLSEEHVVQDAASLARLAADAIARAFERTLEAEGATSVAVAEAGRALAALAPLAAAHSGLDVPAGGDAATRACAPTPWSPISFHATWMEPSSLTWRKERLLDDATLLDWSDLVEPCVRVTGGPTSRDEAALWCALHPVVQAVPHAAHDAMSRLRTMRSLRHLLDRREAA